MRQQPASSWPAWSSLLPLVLLLLSATIAPSNCAKLQLQEKCQKCGETFTGNWDEFFDMEIKEDNGVLVKGRAHRIYANNGAELYHVNPKIVADRDGQTIHDGKCVVVKMSQIMDGEKWTTGFLEYMRDSQNALESLANANAKRIIRTYANKELHVWIKFGTKFGDRFKWMKWSTTLEEEQGEEGKLYSNDQKHIFLSIMEMGKCTLAEYWQQHLETIKKMSIKEQEEKILAVLEEMLLAVQEFHQIAIHNGLAPTNFVYVDEQANGQQQRVLKMVHFDSVKLLPVTEKRRKRRANVTVRLQKSNLRLWQSLYASPEITRENMPPPSKKAPPQVSIKSDIFAVGKIMMELVSELVPKVGTYDGLKSHWDFHLLFTRKAKYPLYPEQKRVEEYIMANYRKLYEIFKAMTTREPSERPTALGVLQLLKGKCQLKFDEAGEYEGTNCNTETTGSIELVVKREDEREENKCAICLDKFEKEQAINVIGPCKHSFHEKCIDSWLEKHATCPRCHATVKSETNTFFHHITNTHFGQK